MSATARAEPDFDSWERSTLIANGVKSPLHSLTGMRFPEDSINRG
jgi:hypothetical protein